MAFSGTVGQTVVNVGQLMADAASLCHKEPSELTAERVDIAKRQLFYLLSSSANIGVNLWAITKTVLGTNANAQYYDLPLGTVEVLNVAYRQFQRPTGTNTSSAGGTADNAFDNDLETFCLQTAPNGRIYVDYGSNNEVPITVIGVMAQGNQTYNLVYEWSDDGITWNTIYAPGSMSYADRQWVSNEIPAPRSARFFGIRETGGGTLSIREALFGYQIFDIPLYRSNRDNYASLPNKDSANNTPPTFWYNRILTQPQIWIWPTFSSPFSQLVIYRHRQLMDVGDLTDQIEVPDRWLDAFVNNLALRMAMTIFKDVPVEVRNDLKQLASYTLSLASNEERDLSPIDMAFNLSAYTR